MAERPGVLSRAYYCVLNGVPARAALQGQPTLSSGSQSSPAIARRHGSSDFVRAELRLFGILVAACTPKDAVSERDIPGES